MTEEDLLNNFSNYLKKMKIKPIVCDANKSKYMDINFICPITNKYISLEAKTFNDTRSNSNFFLSIFGKILKGRWLNSNNEECKNKSVEYGFLFSADNKKQLKHYFNLIQDNDWVTFCKTYNVEYIFIFNLPNRVERYQAILFKNETINFPDEKIDIDDNEETDIDKKDKGD